MVAGLENVRISESGYINRRPFLGHTITVPGSFGQRGDDPNASELSPTENFPTITTDAIYILQNDYLSYITSAADLLETVQASRTGICSPIPTAFPEVAHHRERRPTSSSRSTQPRRTRPLEMDIMEQQAAASRQPSTCHARH